jgi:type I restriction enzyme R subunit
LNESARKLYLGNQFSVVRQLKYSQKNENSLDLGMFVSGLPLFTAELNNPFKGQNVQDGVKQYRLDRDPKEPLFQFGRCLAHFAVDPSLVYVTTELRGGKAAFLPFNQGNKTGERKLLFPRYHQLDCVRRTVADALNRGVGQCYLVQHSAGSGKSNTIAWLAARTTPSPA